MRDARVALLHGGTVVAHGATDTNGHYAFASEPPGEYDVEVAAAGYTTSRTENVFVVVGSDVKLSSTMGRRQTDGANLREIGRVRAGGAASLQTTTTIHSDFDAGVIRNENYVRVGDALNTLPGVNLSAQSSAVGDDIYVNIRGIGATETATLLDGHPIGPVGVAPGTFFNGAPTAFDYQNTPAFALRNVQAVFGTGALGLYGSDAIGGVVDLQTIDPTRTPEFSLQQGIGNYGKTTSALQATGTNGRLGYAIVHAAQGTYGNFEPQRLTQRGLLGTDFSSGNVAANTYSISSNYLLRNDLVKLKYALSPATDLTVTAYSGTSWDDKSGNGDNDNLTYQQQLYTAGQTIGQGGNVALDASGAVQYSCQPGTPGPNGNPAAPGIVVNTDNGFACYDARQFAAASSGAAGGGPGPWQAIRNQDYHARLNSHIGNHYLTLDAYRDNYAVDYNRNLAGALDPSGTFTTGGFDTTFTRTTGYLLSDDIVAGNNDLGFGVFFLRQQIRGDQYDTTKLALVPTQSFDFSESNVFLKDVLTVTPRFQIFANAWLKHSTVTNQSFFDPRLSLVFRPSANDVVRVTGGKASSAPTPSLRLGTSSLNNTPQNITPNCPSTDNPNAQTGIGQVGNPGVGSETGADAEIAYGHRFRGDTQISVSAYSETLTGKIFNIAEPVSVLGASAIPANLLAGYIARIQQFCPSARNSSPASILALLSVTTPLNVASGRFRGIEVSGRYRFNPRLSADYTYDVQSATLSNLPDSILKSNVTLVPGAQLLGIPLHKASFGLDFTSLHGFEARVDTYYVGPNNGFNRGPYFYSNAAVTERIGRHATLNFGVFNLFDQAADRFGRFGLGQFNAENKFGTDRNAFDQQSERFGLPPTQVQLSLTLHT